MVRRAKDQSEKNTPESAGKILAGVSGEQRFFLRNGNSISDYYELYRAFKEVDAETFSHHKNNDKDDFKNWVLGVFNDSTLAQSLTDSNNPKECALAVNKRIKDLNRMLNSLQSTTWKGSSEERKDIPDIKRSGEMKEESPSEKTSSSSPQMIIPLPPLPEPRRSFPFTSKKDEKPSLPSGLPEAPRPPLSYAGNDKMYTIGGSIFALAVLAVTVVSLKAFTGDGLTGAAIKTNVSGTPSWVSWLMAIFILLAIIGLDIALRQKNNEKEEEPVSTVGFRTQKAVLGSAGKEPELSESELDELIKRHQSE